eukprot:360840-Chlamydomonas_euryale.AAC.2
MFSKIRDCPHTPRTAVRAAGPWKNTLAAPPANDRFGLPVSTGLCERAQNRNLIVQPYTFRPEDNQMAPGFYGM